MTKTLTRTKLLISGEFENCGHITYIFKRLFFNITLF
ncbi:hypothetical protein E2C01_020382 [Portunus trituberculatus]|uniref:Uncharacterized protein n=1 Tax=Portunus trituberculatus TaxID=210409 RepID=A0A5B7E154_PORTR|nr:hypothetical protein [Portunus trituberculatus]